MSQLSNTHITEQGSLDTVPNAPDRNKPIGFILRLGAKKTINGISDGEHSWALRYPSNSGSPALFYLLDNQHHNNQLLIVSEPLDDCSQYWKAVDKSSLWSLLVGAQDFMFQLINLGLHIGQDNHMTIAKLE